MTVIAIAHPTLRIREYPWAAKFPVGRLVDFETWPNYESAETALENDPVDILVIMGNLWTEDRQDDLFSYLEAEHDWAGRSQIGEILVVTRHYWEAWPIMRELRTRTEGRYIVNWQQYTDDLFYEAITTVAPAAGAPFATPGWHRWLKEPPPGHGTDYSFGATEDPWVVPGCGPDALEVLLPMPEADQEGEPREPGQD